jgi:hypothetical protein
VSASEEAIEQLKAQIKELRDSALAYRQGVKEINSLIMKTLTPMRERSLLEGDKAKFTEAEAELIKFITELVVVMERMISGVEKAQDNE